MTPYIKTTVVGSYPIPVWLSALPSTPNLRDAVMVAMKTQELAGIDVISDGELSRFDPNHPETNGMIEYFVRPMSGVSTALSRAELEEFRAQPNMGFRAAPAGIVRGPVGEGTLNLQAAYDFVQALAAKPLKFTVTSPYMLAKTLLNKHYPNRRALAMAIAEVLHRQVSGIDAAVLQVDEANLPGSPQDGAWAAEAINVVLSGAPPGTARAVHLCFGNYGGQSIQTGFLRALLPFFNALEADHLVLEFARRGDDELEVFKDLKPGVALGVGVIDIKDNEVETPDEIARRIEHAVRVIGAERVQWVHPDCGFWMLPEWYWPIYVGSGIWQTVGWGSIIYLAAIATIDPTLYEAARVDGASRFQQLWHITLPGMSATIIVLLILRLGAIMSVGYEKTILLYNPLVYDTADVISSYTYRRGILNADYGFSAAVGLFNSVINFALLLTANWLARRRNGSGLF